jgi:hypothetical protein
MANAVSKSANLFQYSTLNFSQTSTAFHPRLFDKFLIMEILPEAEVKKYTSPPITWSEFTLPNKQFIGGEVKT